MNTPTLPNIEEAITAISQLGWLIIFATTAIAAVGLFLIIANNVRNLQERDALTPEGQYDWYLREHYREGVARLTMDPVGARNIYESNRITELEW